jgi:hypothetical protein
MPPDLDAWLPDPAVRVAHRRQTAVEPERLWRAACEVRLRDTRLLGRLVRWRIPGVPDDASFEDLLRNPPFMVLEEAGEALVSGLVGRIWTLRRDYPRLSDPQEFRAFRARGNARVLMANWIETDAEGNSILCSESRVEVFGLQGRVGLRLVRPIVQRFGGLVGSDGLATAVRRAQRS